jgi:S1-C subfamily serine protease
MTERMGRWIGLATLCGVVGFVAGVTLSQARTEVRMVQQSAEIDALRFEVTRAVRTIGEQPRGTSGTSLDLSAGDEWLVDAVADKLRSKIGLVPVEMIRERRGSFVELYATDHRGSRSYGTAGYLGDGYFITVKHAVVSLETRGEDGARHARRSVQVRIDGRLVPASVVDMGDADREVDPGDWAIIKVREPVTLSPLKTNLAYGFPFADPILRLGNDYSKGIIAATGYVGEHAGGLVTCLVDGHPGVSGGGVLNQDGELVGIPIGRMDGDFRFSFILPLRADMFRKLPLPQQADRLLVASHGLAPQE